ncbi:hypothetical protein GIV24_29080 [Pseudomonas syringae]|nr:hypothetical protein [Pseudomonas syringae]
MLTANPRTYYHQLAALVGWTSLLRLFRLRQRTLILAGERDTLVRLYNAHILRRTIRRAELCVLPGEGHFFIVTSASRTAEAIREFLCQHHGDEEATLMISNGMLNPHLVQSERH